MFLQLSKLTALPTTPQDTMAVTEALMEYSAARHVQKETDLQMNVETATERDSLHTHDAPAGTRQELQVSTDSGPARKTEVGDCR